VSRYKYTKLLKLGPVDGFMIHTPDDRKLKDTHPQTIVIELNRMADRIKRLEEALTLIGEYWNCNTNERAMEDACWYAIHTAVEALQSKETKL